MPSLPWELLYLVTQDTGHVKYTSIATEVTNQKSFLCSYRHESSVSVHSTTQSFHMHETYFKPSLLPGLHVPTSETLSVGTAWEHQATRTSNPKAGKKLIWLCVYSSVPTPHLHTYVLQTQMAGKKTHLAVNLCSLCSTSQAGNTPALDTCEASFPICDINTWV